MTDTITIVAIIAGVSGLLVSTLRIIRSSTCCKDCFTIQTRSVPQTPRDARQSFEIPLSPMPRRRSRSITEPISYVDQPKPRPSMIPIAISKETVT